MTRTDLVTLLRRQDEHAKQRAYIVHAGSNGGQQEVLVSLQTGNDQSAQREEQGGQQVQPHQAGYQLLLPESKPGGNPQAPADQWFCKERNQDGETRGYQKDQVGNAGEQIPGFRTASLFQIF